MYNMYMQSSREKDVVRLLSDSELRDMRRREDREGSPYSDRDMLLDHIELSGQHGDSVWVDDDIVTGAFFFGASFGFLFGAALIALVWWIT